MISCCIVLHFLLNNFPSPFYRVLFLHITIRFTISYFNLAKLTYLSLYVRHYIWFNTRNFPFVMIDIIIWEFHSSGLFFKIVKLDSHTHPSTISSNSPEHRHHFLKIHNLIPFEYNSISFILRFTFHFAYFITILSAYWFHSLTFNQCQSILIFYSLKM